MFKLLSKLVRRKPRVDGKPAVRRKPAQRFQPHVEELEHRSLLSVSSLFFNGKTLVVQSSAAATNVEVRRVGANIQIVDVGANRAWSYAATRVGVVELHGSAQNDRLVNKAANLAVRAYGFAGSDYLQGGNAGDLLVGGDGNDMLVGVGGNDVMHGEAGNDHLNGGLGADRSWGQAGDDVLIAVDNTTGDYVDGGAGRDTVWVDRTGSLNDSVVGATAEDKVQYVTGFANGADRTLNGDRITDPTAKSGHSYRTFSGYSLFSSTGPGATDIKQGALGDCWMLAGMSAVALDSPQTLRNNIVDFNDGTYGVALGGRFYRVDNDLPVYNGTSSLAYAKLGAESSLWVAIVEKAFAHYRTGANTYASIEGGWGVEVNRAFGSTSAGSMSIQSYGNATNLLNDLYNRWNTYQAVTIGFLGLKSGATGVPLVMGHMYTVYDFVRNGSGAITGVTLRNPWGVDGGGNNDGNPNDGLVTVTAAQLFSCIGAVNWGRV